MKEFLVLITDQCKWAERMENSILHRHWGPRLLLSCGIAITRISKSFTFSAQTGKDQVWRILPEVSTGQASSWGSSVSPTLITRTQSRCSPNSKGGWVLRGKGDRIW